MLCSSLSSDSMLFVASEEYTRAQFVTDVNAWAEKYRRPTPAANMSAIDKIRAASLVLGGDPFDGMLGAANDDSDEDYDDEEPEARAAVRVGALKKEGVDAAHRLTKEPVLSGLFNSADFASE
jgi:hypothetical protein